MRKLKHSNQVTEPDFKARQAGSQPELTPHPPLPCKWWFRLEEEGAQVSWPWAQLAKTNAALTDRWTPERHSRGTK